VLDEMEKGMAVKVQEDLDWLESELRKGNGKFLVGEGLTAADTMVAFSVQFIFARKLGTMGKRWVRVERWLEGLEAREAYKRAVERSGYKL
jgi:glutathione S-transferase